MGDPFFHLGFTRRLRFYDGLHPFAVQTLVRHPLPAAVTSTLPGLPALDQAQSGFFKRLLGRGRAENLRWEKLLSEPEAPYADYLLALLQGGETGAMFRLSAALGTLSQRVLAESTGALTAGMDAKERRGTERGAGRIWLQMNVPSLRELGSEWRSAIALEDPTSHQKILAHVSQALQKAHGESPGAEVLVRWVRGLAAELRPISERGGLPPQGSVPEHEVRSRFFEGDGVFLQRVQSAKERFVFLANELCNAFLLGEPDPQQVEEALFDTDRVLRHAPERMDLEEEKLRWRDQVCALRADALVRGRNSKPAFYGTQDMPPLPEDASGPHAHAMPPVPKLTQELSLADVEQELSGATSIEAPEETQPIALASIEEEHSIGSESVKDEAIPRAPAVTQALSLDDIEEEISQTADAADASDESASADVADDEEATDKIPVAPAMTQALSLDDIEEEISAQGDEAEATLKSPVAPAATQALSLEDIEEEISEREAEPAPAAPAMTQALSVEDIEEEISERHFVEDATALPPAPEQTQSLDPEDIEEETLDPDVGAADGAGISVSAPDETQTVSVDDIEAEDSEPVSPAAKDAAAMEEQAPSVEKDASANTLPGGETDTSADGPPIEAEADTASATEGASADSSEEAGEDPGTEDAESDETRAEDSSDESAPSTETGHDEDDAEDSAGNNADEPQSVVAEEDTGTGSARDWTDSTNVGPRPISIPPSEPEVLLTDGAAVPDADAEAGFEHDSKDSETDGPATGTVTDASRQVDEEDSDAAGEPVAGDASSPVEDDGAQKAQ